MRRAGRWLGVALAAMFAGCVDEGADPDAGGATAPRPRELGGVREVGPVRLRLHPGQFSGDDRVTATPASEPMPLPAGVRTAGPAVAIHVMDPAALSAPLVVEMPYDPARVTDPANLGVLRFDPELNAWEPHAVVGVDTARRVVLFKARQFSVASVVEWLSDLPTNTRVTGFDLAQDTWNFVNYANPISQGMCFGMSGMVQWYFPLARAAGFTTRPHLRARFSDTQRAKALVFRTQIATNANSAAQETWPLDLSAPASSNTVDLPRQLRATLRQTDAPLVMLIDSGSRAGGAHARHAIVLYGFEWQGPNAGRFLAYDPNTPGVEVPIPWQGTRFLPLDLGGYRYLKFGYLTRTSLPYTQALTALVDAYDSGFAADANVLWVTPSETTDLTDRYIQQVDIATSNDFWSDGAHELRAGFAVYFTLGDFWWPMERTADGIFRTYMPVMPGVNEGVIIAGTNIPALRSNGTRYHHSNAVATARYRVQGQQQHPSSVVVMADWDTPSTDLDLFVVPRSAPGDTIYWARRQTDRGELSLDSRNMGPEFFAIAPGEHARVPNETYRARLHLHQINAESPVVIGGITANASIFTRLGTNQPTRVSTTVFLLRMPNPGNLDPTARGPDWVDLFDFNPATGDVQRVCQRYENPARDQCAAP